MSPPFVAQKAGISELHLKPAKEEIFTTEPIPAFIMWGMHAFIMRNGPVRLTSSILRHSATSRSTTPEGF
jgi:hypothetical protein